MKETFKYKGFEGSMEFSAEDECLVGEILFIRSKIIYVGENFTELKKAFEDSVDTYIEYCDDKGIHPEKPCSGTFNVRVGSELHLLATKVAYTNEMSLNEVIVKSLEAFLLDPPNNTKGQSVSLNNTHVSISRTSTLNIQHRNLRHFN